VHLGHMLRALMKKKKNVLTEIWRKLRIEELLYLTLFTSTGYSFYIVLDHSTWDVSSDVGFLCEKFALPRDTIKGTLSIIKMNA